MQPMIGNIGSHLGVVSYLAVNGSKIADLVTRVAAVIATAAKVVIINPVVNDINASTNQATFAATYANYLALLKAGMPGVKIGCVGCFADGEKYPDPGDHDGGPTDFNTIIAGVAYNAGAYYLDARTAQQAWEKANNTPAPGVSSGLLTFDGVHPLAATGVPIMSAAIQAQIKFGWLP